MNNFLAQVHLQPGAGEDSATEPELSAEETDWSVHSPIN